MDAKGSSERGIAYYQAMAKGFTPIMVSANFAALESPVCQKKDSNPLPEVHFEVAKAA